MGPMGVYRLFDEGDRKPMGSGGMMTSSANAVSCWGSIQRRLNQAAVNA